MGFISEARSSDSPYIETVIRGRTEGNGSTIRPAESHWHMVFTKINGKILPFAVGPLPTAGVVSYTEGAELLWIKFALGAFMPHMPTRHLLDRETILPEASQQSFWLHGSAWQFPTYDNVETFVERLVRDEALVRDPVVSDALQGRQLEMAPRTLRHRFLQATGLSQGHIRQIERAQQAATLLQQGASIFDTVYQSGYFDQPHLTRSLKQWVGHTPAQLIRAGAPE
jgi:AraC-like DNA-binding protein